MKTEQQHSGNSTDPKNVYLGLPEHISDFVIWVLKKYRTNPLSREPGGSDIVVEHYDGRVLGYNRIKKPSVYVETLFREPLGYASDEFIRSDDQSKIEVAKRKISKVFTRNYKNESERSTASFSEVWDSVTSNEMPWESLKRLECQQSEQDNLYQRENDF